MSTAEKIIKANSQSFYFASQFLPPKAKEAIWSLYAFCRLTDDLADNPNASLDKLLAWELDFKQNCPQNEILAEFKQIINKYKIPMQYPLDLIAGCKSDLTHKQYNSFAELAEYCYQVASTVGLMSAYILGFKQDYKTEMETYAIKAGIALQLTNIIRDINEDLQRNRIYLPKADFEVFNCNYQNPISWHQNDNFNQLVNLQIQRARLLYAESWAGLKYLKPIGGLSIAIALGVYENILNAVENNDYDVFNQRAFVSFPKKVFLLPYLFFKFFLNATKLR